MQAIHLLNSLKHGGGENVAFNYAQVLRKFNVPSVFVGKYASADYEKMIASTVEIRHTLSRKLIRESNFIFIHTNINLIRLLLFRLLPLGWRRKQIIYIQHLNYKETKFRLLALLINLVCTDFIQITPVTTSLVSKYIHIKTHFIVNFYLNKYPVAEWHRIKKETRRALGIRPEQTVVMFSGVFKPGKNVGEFIALANSMQQRKDVTFLLIGDGPEAGVVREYQGENLIWTGFVNDVEQYLIASDIYVFLSLYEMMPVALIEAINTNKYIACYKTLINDFVMNHHTFMQIDSGMMNVNTLPSGSTLKHYDADYAIQVLQELLNLPQ